MTGQGGRSGCGETEAVEAADPEEQDEGYVRVRVRDSPEEAAASPGRRGWGLPRLTAHRARGSETLLAKTSVVRGPLARPRWVDTSMAKLCPPPRKYSSQRTLFSGPVTEGG